MTKKESILVEEGLCPNNTILKKCKSVRITKCVKCWEAYTKDLAEKRVQVSIRKTSHD